MIRKDFITVESCFCDEPMMIEVPTKAEYDDFRRRVNAAFELRDKEIDELKDRIAALETKNGATKPYDPEKPDPKNEGSCSRRLR